MTPPVVEVNKFTKCVQYANSRWYLFIHDTPVVATEREERLIAALVERDMMIRDLQEKLYSAL